MTTTQPATPQRDLDNSKPLGDSGTGTSGGGSGGNAHGNVQQGVRPPDAPQLSSTKAEPGEPDSRNLTQHPKQTAEVPLGSGNTPEASGRGGFGSHSSEPEGISKQWSVNPMPATSHKNDKPSK
jgi:hypothetical protein